ncbi:formylmethanofuran dehydrogenase [Candidatus Bathyarchaeota archaeon]|nr:formylmethanofuran dehydrogenase [Candidatus Bathyarchaeota archaeon]
MNFVETPKQRNYTRELEETAIQFHGHGGPFLVIGLKMGLHALKTLDAKGWFNLTCTVYLNWAPPDSCVIDGIQSSTGCTMGKHNITVEDGKDITAEFTARNKSVKIKLRDDILAEIRATLDSKEKYNSLMESLVDADPMELFQVESYGF